MVGHTSLLRRRERVLKRMQDIFEFLKTTNNPRAAEVRIKTIPAIRAEFDKIQEDIIEFNDKVKIEEQLPLDEMDSAFSELVFASELLYSELSEHRAETPVSVPTEFLHATLPKLKIPHFAGDIREWQTFIELFNSSIHNTSLPDIVKYQHLRSYLQGEALTLIQSFPLTAANYTLAYTALHQRYQNNRLLASFHLNRLFSYQVAPLNKRESLHSFLSVHKDSVEAFNNLPIPDKTDFLLFQLTYSHLDRNLQTSFDNKFSPSAIPSFKDLIDHVESSLKYKELQLTQDPVGKSKGNISKNTPRDVKTFINSVKSTSNSKLRVSCCLCNSTEHSLNSCPRYTEKSPSGRRAIVSSKGLCFNCLKRHLTSQCPSQYRCRLCGEKHHSSLHLDEQKTAVTPAVTTHTLSRRNEDRQSVILATALVQLRSPSGDVLQVRALLDQGSEVSLISESVVQLLKLQRQRASLPLKGIGAQASGTTNGVVHLTLAPHFSSTNVSLNLQAYVLPKLTIRLPSVKVSPRLHHRWKGLTLADPSFSKSGKIDLLLGADVYGQLLRPGLIKTGRHSPTAQNTNLGWIISGLVPNQSASTSGRAATSLQCCIDQDLNTLLQKFWEQETIQTPRQPVMSPDEEECERHFLETHRRDPSGRYVVKLPFKRSPLELGESVSTARRTLMRLHNKFETTQQLSELYSDFMEEYKKLGHMVPNYDKPNERGRYFLPHHGVLRTSSTTTKLRVVFNGSTKSSNGLSLNDILHVGPKLQNNIADVIQWWRRFRYVFSADIEKMFRQISVAQEDQIYQQILWSPNASQKPQEYRLTTVTYGLAASPYLANRVIQQLSKDEGHRFPLAVPVIQNGMYVDDLFGGADSPEEARLVAIQLKKLLTAGGFHLHKWNATHPELLEGLSDGNTSAEVPFITEEFQAVKTLGIIWNPHTDKFTFQTPIRSGEAPFTKRKILSHIAQLFDPLGWVTPVTIKAKIFLQELWLAQVDWDEELPEGYCLDWSEFLEQLQHLSSLAVPRWIFISNQTQMEIHGFSDASESAYAAVVYLRLIESDSSVKISLLQAKSKVAPLKRMTIPRLELSAAVMLVQLTHHLIKVLNLSPLPVHLWTDSTVALTWIRGHPSSWKDFVCNRVEKIQDTLPAAQWHHVPGQDNPADCASRGCSPQQLKTHGLWWEGPQWLRLHEDSWPATTQTVPKAVDLETRAKTMAFTQCNEAPVIWDLVNKYSKLNTLLRVTAICRRFLTKRSPSITSNSLSPSEIHHERMFWIRTTQCHFFPHQIHLLSKGEVLRRSDPLHNLNPFLDESGILRVGGRLRNSTLHPDQKHPAILPKYSPLTSLLIREAHDKTLHGGTQLTLNFLRQTCWIIGGRIPVKAAIHNCIRCTRYRAQTRNQLMGQLPPFRTAPTKPFLHSGVDYAGPFCLKSWRGRGGKIYKGYVVLFVCLSTSALHLDLVTDYTVEGFIAAYRRFTSRRGICATLVSDCGTNLTGADKELRRMFSKASEEMEKLSALLANDGTTWKFNPPSAPHFGGKWESGVRAVKYHLRRVIGDTPLTYEEFATLLTQIEAVLNSRPLCPLSDDPEDLEALTPAHFLIGTSLASLPEPQLEGQRIPPKQRWTLLQGFFQRLWKRWSQEYLQRFLSRPKWTSSSDNLKPGQLVLITDERYPPSKWPLGRITETHPGPDGLVRVVSVKTKNSVLKRPIVKLCVLPQL